MLASLRRRLGARYSNQRLLARCSSLRLAWLIPQQRIRQWPRSAMPQSSRCARVTDAVPLEGRSSSRALTNLTLGRAKAPMRLGRRSSPLAAVDMPPPSCLMWVTTTAVIDRSIRLAGGGDRIAASRLRGRHPQRADGARRRAPAPESLPRSSAAAEDVTRRRPAGGHQVSIVRLGCCLPPPAPACVIQAGDESLLESG